MKKGVRGNKADAENTLTKRGDLPSDQEVKAGVGIHGIVITLEVLQGMTEHIKDILMSVPISAQEVDQLVADILQQTGRKT